MLHENITKIRSSSWDFEIEIRYDETKVLPPYPVSAQLIAKNVHINRGETVLDLGTGSGIQAIVAKKLGASYVLATDISESALEYAKKNFLINGVSCDTRISDLFESISNRQFDVIIANPPMFASKKKEDVGVDGGHDGRRLLDKIISSAGTYLTKSGRLVIPTESYLGLKRTEELLLEAGFNFKVIAKGICLCSMHMQESLNYDAIKGNLITHYGLQYFTSNIYESIKK